MPPHYDSLLCKVITRGATRDAAADRMIAALGELVCEGVPTTVPMHLAILRSEQFRARRYDTRAIPGWAGAERWPTSRSYPSEAHASASSTTARFEAHARGSPPSKSARERRREVAAGWGPKYVERVHAKGKLTARERVDALNDPGTRVLEVGTFVNYGDEFQGGLRSPAAGVVTAFARVEGRWCMVIANDNTVALGLVVAADARRRSSARRRWRCVCACRRSTSSTAAGCSCPSSRARFPGARGAGHIFKMNSLLSAAAACRRSRACSATASPAAATCRSSATAST